MWACRLTPHPLGAQSSAKCHKTTDLLPSLKGCETFLAVFCSLLPHVFSLQVLGTKHKHEYLVDHPLSDPAGSCGNFVFIPPTPLLCCSLNDVQIDYPS